MAAEKIMALIEEQASIPQQIPGSIFRAYDIRGVVDEELTYETVRLISQTIGSEALDNGIDSLLVGFDGRLSSPTLSHAVVEGILASSCNVVELGMIPTPLLYFATHTTEFTSGVMLTASHNPANYNGLKVVFKQTCLAENQIQKIRERVETRQLRVGSGRSSTLDVSQSYIEDVSTRIQLPRPLRLVVDCGNAVPAVIAPRLFERLGCDVLPLYCEIDGNFPNHHPDPTIPQNLQSLAECVISHEADLGIAFDGDGDRLGIVSNLGEFVDADRILMLLTEHIAPRYPSAPIVFDVKCSTHLAELISKAGATPIMHRSGHSFMKQKMQETSAPLGGEYSAHIFIKDGWFGYDDGIYAAARIVEILSSKECTSSELFARYEKSISTNEIKVAVDESSKFQLIDRLLELAEFPGARLITLDGLRVEFQDGWGLVRASNTSPAILLRFEADSVERLQAIKGEFKALLAQADKNLDVSVLGNH